MYRIRKHFAYTIWSLTFKSHFDKIKWMQKRKDIHLKMYCILTIHINFMLRGISRGKKHHSWFEEIHSFRKERIQMQIRNNRKRKQNQKRKLNMLTLKRRCISFWSRRIDDFWITVFSGFQKDTCTLMFHEALFITAKTRKLPKCPLTEECLKKMWYVSTILLSHEKEWNNAILTTCMDLEVIILSDMSDKDRYHDILYMWNPIKMTQKILFTKQKQSYRFWNKIYGYQRRNIVGRDKLGVWD